MSTTFSPQTSHHHNKNTLQTVPSPSQYATAVCEKKASVHLQSVSLALNSVLDELVNPGNTRENFGVLYIDPSRMPFKFDLPELRLYGNWRNCQEDLQKYARELRRVCIESQTLASLENAGWFFHITAADSNLYIPDNGHLIHTKIWASSRPRMRAKWFGLWGPIVTEKETIDTVYRSWDNEGRLKRDLLNLSGKGERKRK